MNSPSKKSLFVKQWLRPYRMALLSAIALSLFGSINAHADESGTLIVAAIAGNTAVLAVDSQVETNGVAGDIDYRRKFFRVGQTGACALDGWIGGAPDIVLADNLRDTLKGHPDQSVEVALPRLLLTLSMTWNQRSDLSLENLPKHRKPGDLITQFLCVDRRDGHPKLYEAGAFVADDGTARLQLDTLSSCGKVLNIGGYLSSDDLLQTAASSNWQILGMDAKDKFREVIADFRSDEKAVAAFLAWRDAENPRNMRDGLACNVDNNAAAELTLQQVQTLSRGLFRSVEKFARGEVGPPNVVFISSNAKVDVTPLESSW